MDGTRCRSVQEDVKSIRWLRLLPLSALISFLPKSRRRSVNCASDDRRRFVEELALAPPLPPPVHPPEGKSSYVSMVVIWADESLRPPGRHPRRPRRMSCGRISILKLPIIFFSCFSLFTHVLHLLSEQVVDAVSPLPDQAHLVALDGQIAHEAS